MPHYVLQLDDGDGSEDTFGIYSSIVDNLLTEPMTASETLQWLTERDYSFWLKPYDVEAELAKPDPMSESFIRSQAEYFYWNDAGFCYGKLSDEYFCLPRRIWRWE